MSAPSPIRNPAAAATRLIQSRQTAGFTLVELLTVIVIIAILAALTLGVSQAVLRKSSESRAFSQMVILQSGLESFKSQYGDYPPMDSPLGVGSPFSEQNLAAALDGHARWVSSPSTGTLIWEIVPMGRVLNDGGTVPNSIGEKYTWGHEFIILDQFKHEVDPNTGSNILDITSLYDPWWDGVHDHNAYLYRYKTTNDVLHPATRNWQASSYLIVSRGPDEKQENPNDNFIWKTVNGHSDLSGFLVDDYGDATAHPGLADNIVVGSFSQRP